jgi:hypothetical protein
MNKAIDADRIIRALSACGYLDDSRMKGLSPWDACNYDKPFPISKPKDEK